MSAVTWESIPAPVSIPSRPRLVSVPTGRDVPARQMGAVRITRAGRLTITLAVAVIALSMAAWTLIAPSPGGVDHTVVVESGQSLWQIAAAELPALDTSAAVVEIQQLNNLQSGQVRIGQVLRIPAS